MRTRDHRKAEEVDKRRFELLEWRDRRYQHTKFFVSTHAEANAKARLLNKGYTGPRFIVKEVQAW